VNSFETQ
jgi:hypothetical protein